MPHVEINFAALPGHVRTARMITTAVCRRAGVPDATIDEIKLAVGEACARAVRVNRDQEPDALVEVRLEDTAEAFTVSVADRGSATDGQADRVNLFELGDLPLAGADGDNEPPGLGLALIEGLVDEMNVLPGPDGTGTVVTMRWQTAAKPADAAGSLTLSS